MTKPVVVEAIENAPGVLKVNTKAWVKGPSPDAPEPQADSAAVQPSEPEDFAPVK